MSVLTNTIGLQDALCEEVEKILAGVRVVNEAGEHAPFHVYSQSLPRTYDMDDPELYPYALVAYDSSTTAAVMDPWAVTMYVLIAMYDNDDSNQGHRLVVPVMERIANRFLRVPLLGSYWTARPNMEMTMQTTDFHPFFYGQVKLTFDQHKMGREDPLDGGFQVRFERS